MVVSFGADLAALATGVSGAKALVAGFGLAAVGAGVMAVKAAGDWQASVTALSTGAGESVKNLGMVSQGMLNMAVQTGTSTSELSAGMYMIESAGYHGAAGLQVLQAAAEGAKVGGASLADVANGVTTAMTDYSSSGLTAAQATNTLIATVAAGKTHMADLANSFASILPTASAVGVKFVDVSAAMATMTGEGVPAADAATYLRQTLMSLESPSASAKSALESIGLSSTQVSNEMKISLPGALQMITDGLAKKFPVGSQAYMDALKNIAGGSKQMQGLLDLTGQHLSTFATNLSNIKGAADKGGSGIAGWDQVQGDFNFKMDQAKSALETLAITVGSKLLPIISPLIGNIATLVGSFTTWVGSGHAINDALTLTGSKAQIALPILAGLGALVLGVLVPAFWSWASATIAATWPLLLVIAGVTGLVAGFVALYQHVAPFRSFIDNLVNGFKQVAGFVSANFIPAMQQIGAFLQANVLPILQQIGNFLVSTFTPVWQQLVQLWQGQLMPLFQQLQPALAQLAPLFQLIGIVVGGLVVTTIGLLVGLLSGLAKGISYMVEGLAHALSGVVQFITGIVQVVGGIVQFFVDLFTGKFSKLGGDLAGIWAGIKNMFMGVLNTIGGLFQAAWGFISGLIGGFVQGVIGFFTTLFNELVGHSIIPDMINGIFSWFAQLPGRVGSFVGNMVSTALGKLSAFVGTATSAAGNIVTGIATALGKLVSQAGSIVQKAMDAIKSGLANLTGLVEAGANIVKQIASGIINAIGSFLGNAMNQVGNFIQSHLPHSPAKMGPLVSLAEAGANIPDQIAQGILKNKTALQASMNMVLAPVVSLMTQPVTASLSSNTSLGVSPSMAANNQQQAPVLHNHVYLDGRELTDQLGSHIVQKWLAQGPVLSV